MMQMTLICRESREQVDESLERWRYALERREMKVSGSKTEYTRVNERETGVTDATSRVSKGG